MYMYMCWMRGALYLCEAGDSGYINKYILSLNINVCGGDCVCVSYVRLGKRLTCIEGDSRT